MFRRFGSSQWIAMFAIVGVIVSSCAREASKGGLGIPRVVTITSPAEMLATASSTMQVTGRCKRDAEVLLSYGSGVTGPATASCINDSFSVNVTFSGTGGARSVTAAQQASDGTIQSETRRINYTLGNQVWAVQEGVAGADVELYGVATDSSGNVYTSGYTTGNFGAVRVGVRDAWVAKYDTNGTPKWKTQFGVAGATTYSQYVSVDSNGYVYIAGKTDGAFTGMTNAGGFDAFLAKLDSSGNVIWKSMLGSTGTDLLWEVVPDANGEYLYAVGNAAGAIAGQPHNGGANDILVTKYRASDGAQMWVRLLGTTAVDVGAGVGVDASGNVYVGGATTGSLGAANAGNYDIVLAKFSSSGGLQWVKQRGSAAEEQSYNIAVNASGEVAMVGYTAGAFAGALVGSYDAFVLKFTSGGDLVWQSQFGSAGDEMPAGVVVDQNGYVYVGGDTSGSIDAVNGGWEDFFVRLYDTNGNTVWKKQFASASDDWGGWDNCVALDSDGNLFYAGMTWGNFAGPGIGSYDVVLMKIH